MQKENTLTIQHELPPCDVLVAGGGIAGVFAALAARRQGADTVLVEQHSCVGGQGTFGGVYGFCGDTSLVNKDWEDMVRMMQEYAAISEYRPNRDARSFKGEYLKFVLQEMLAKAGVRLLLHTHLVAVCRTGDTCEAVILYNKSGFLRLGCAQAIDATGDADLTAMGGWPTVKGGPVFSPAGAVESGAPRQLPMSLYFTMINTGQPVRAHLPSGCPEWADDEAIPMTSIHGDKTRIFIKMKVIGHDATDGESLSQAEQQGRRQMMALVYHLQTKGYHGVVYGTFALEWVAPHIGVREGRRIQAQVQLSVDDVLKGRHFIDGVAVGSYHVDYHWPAVVQRAGTGLTTQGPPYQIPLRALRPVGADNVLAAGRCVGGEQLAMSSYRVMATCAQTGCAAGTAAGLAIRQRQALAALDADTLRQQLRQAGVRLDLAPYGSYLRGNRAKKEPVFLPQDVPFASCHASTLVMLPNGDVVCAWFGGTREGATDVAIWMAIRHEECWTQPFLVARHAGEPSWNPVLFMPDTSRLFPAANQQAAEADALPVLYLFYRVGLTIPSWRAYIRESRDGGRSWSPATPMPAGLLGPIKNKPIVLADGTWLAGSSVETADEWYCCMEYSADHGRTWQPTGKIALPGQPKGIIQPTLWESAPGHVHALLRSRGVGRICRTDSADGGRTWCPAYITDLPNPNSGIDVTTMTPAPSDPGYGSELPPLALIYNPVEKGRTPLGIALSYDNGITWNDGITLEDQPGEYSYPAIIPTAQGIAACYTYQRTRIEYVQLSLEHLTGKAVLPAGSELSPRWLQALNAAG